jgi:hypothetical protein
MTRRKPILSASLPGLLAELAFTSWSTIAERSRLIAIGQCSPAEYGRMATEKVEAAQESMVALATAPGPDAFGAVIDPWLRRSKANARRLQRR